MIELALVAPLLVMLLLGVIEFGTIYRNENIVAGALRAAARVESQQPTATTVDQLALQTFNAATSGLKNMTLQEVIIYKAPSGGAPPAACLSASTAGNPPHGVSGTCNVYTATQTSTATANTAFFGCPSTQPWDGDWCPGATNRPTTLSTPMTQVGVYAKYTYTDLTHLMPTSTMTIDDYVVYAIQPTV
jgi:Flp pilus assembly protein TadG